MKTWVRILILTAALAATASAQLSLNWCTVDGGGGTTVSADGRFTLSGTVGQPDASGPMLSSDGRFELGGGFWQTEIVLCDCTLSVGISGGNLLISWPGGLGGCILEYADNLVEPGTATVWHPVSPQPGGGIYVTPLTGTQRYFRLRSP